MDAAKFIEQHMTRKEAEQDQELAEAVEWMRDSDLSGVCKFWMRLNNSVDNIADLASMTDAELQLVRAMAMIGYHEVFKRAFPTLGR